MTADSSSKDSKGKVTLSWGTQSPVTSSIPTAQTSAAKPAPQPAPKPAPAPQPAMKPAPESKAEPHQEPKAESKPEIKAETQKKRSGCAAAIFDTLLVSLLLGALGGGAWYVQQQLEQYRVPSPLELAQKEYLELCQQREEIQATALKADEQIHMRQRITHLDRQLADVKNQLAEHTQNIEKEQNRIYALQREIRQEDKTSRDVAKSMLIGLPIGDAANTNGRVYPNAIIHRLEGGRITLRTPHGQVRFPLSQLVKDNLPDVVRYAIGLDDMVDMSDFVVAKGETAPRKRKGRLIEPRKAPLQVVSQPTDYEPESAPPVVNAQTPPAVMHVDPAPIPEENESWQAPEAEIPIGE